MGFRLRSLMNVRAPMAADETFLAVQDDYLCRELDARGVVRLSDLRPLCGDLYLWQGDITRLQCGAIVNAANAGMTGCYIPRSEERRVGKECASMCRSRWSPYH